MDKLFNQHLQETFDYFRKNENVNIFSNYDYLSSDTALFEEYVTRMTEGMSAENAADVAQLIANGQQHYLAESMYQGVAPLGSLMAPMIRKLYPKLNLKNAVKNEVATKPALVLTWEKPYISTADASGKEVKTYLPNGLVTKLQGAGANDLAGNRINYRFTTFPTTLDLYAEGTVGVNGEKAPVSATSKIKAQPLDVDCAIVSYTVGGKVVSLHERLDFAGNIVYDYNVVITDEEADVAESGLTAGTYSGTILVKTDMAKAVVKVVVVADEGAAPTEVVFHAHFKTEYHENALSIGYDTGRLDVQIPQGEHLSATLPVEKLQDINAMYQIDLQKKLIENMTRVLATKLDSDIYKFLVRSFIDQPTVDEFNHLPGSVEYTRVFDVQPSPSFAGNTFTWREELKRVIDHLATVIKTNTYLGEGEFAIVAHPVDAMLITNVEWKVRQGAAVEGVNVDYALGYFRSTYDYKLVSSPLVKQGQMYVVFIPSAEDQFTYKYFAYLLCTESNYRDPNRANVPAVMMTKRDLCHEFMPAIGCVQIIGNDGYGQFRDFIPTQAYGTGVGQSAFQSADND